MFGGGSGGVSGGVFSFVEVVRVIFVFVVAVRWLLLLLLLWFLVDGVTPAQSPFYIVSGQGPQETRQAQRKSHIGQIIYR